MDGRSAFVLDAAVRLIAAGGTYGKFTLETAIDVVLMQIDMLEDYFTELDSVEEEQGTIQ